MEGEATMKKITCIYYSFDELKDLLRRACFTNGEQFGVEVVDHYYWRIVLYDPDIDEDVEYPSISDFNALPEFSRLLGMRFENTHASRDGVWFEGEPQLPKTSRRKKKQP